MFTLDETAFWAEKIIHPILVYIALIFLIRIFGKRELGQLNPIDLVVILSLSNTVQNAIIGADNSLVGGIVGAIALLAINYFVAFLKFKSPKMETLIEGKPVTLIENGKFNEQVIKKEMMTREDLDVVAHEEGFDNADDIKKFVLDPNGSFLVEGKEENNEDKFKKAVLRKLDELNQQIAELKAVKGN